jgi:hypothetical protein
MSEARDTAEVHRIAGEPDDPTLIQWARFRDQFAEAFGDGFWSLEDLEQKIASKRAFFFPGKNAAVVGMIEVYPGGNRVMQFHWAVGDVAEIVSMEPGLVAISRMMGCTGVLIEGRSAWAKLLKPLGYEPFSVTVHKAI